MAKHKYKAKPTVVDGIRFAGQKEARRYGELKLLERKSFIRNLILQPSFPLEVLGVECRPIGIYRADFEYEEWAGVSTGDRHLCVSAGPDRWARVVEDVKGFKTPLYRWKKKHVEAQYGITIREV